MSLDNRILPPNVGAYYGIESIEGYDPIYDARYEEFIAALNRNKPDITPPFGFNRIITSPNTDSPLLPLLNIRYVLTLEDVKNPDLALVFQEGSTRVYEYKKALPRIYPVTSVLHEDSKLADISALYNASFHPHITATVEDALSVPAHAILNTDSIRITSYSDSSITAVSSFRTSHFVVFADTFDPGWNITIDGKPDKIHRADYSFIGFLVPQGTHTVQLSYE